jgi:hypothetical protein
MMEMKAIKKLPPTNNYYDTLEEEECNNEEDEDDNVEDTSMTCVGGVFREQSCNRKSLTATSNMYS